MARVDGVLRLLLIFGLAAEFALLAIFQRPAQTTLDTSIIGAFKGPV